MVAHVYNYLSDKELPRQVLAANKITKNILDRYENTLVEITGEYKRTGIEFDKVEKMLITFA